MPVTRLVARPDDSQLAYSHGGRLGLLDAAMHELAAVDVAHDPRWLGFVAGQLVTLDGDTLVAYDLPSLTEAARCAVPAGSNVRAVVGERAVLDTGGGSGLDATVARFLGKKIDLSSFTLKVPPLHFLAQEEHHVMVVNAQTTELVDCVSKRVQAVMALPLPPPPREVGVTHQLRYVWTFRPGRPELIVVRLSDGRPFQQVLDAPIENVFASVSGPWVVASTEDGPRRVHVQTLAVHAVEADLRKAACVTGGSEPSLYWLDTTLRMQRTSLSGQAVVSSASGRVQGGLRMEIEPVGTMGGPKAAATTTSTSTSTPTKPTTTTSTMALSAKPGWRLVVAEWAKQVMAGKDVAMPAMEDGLAEVARRAALGTDGARLLVLLYGAWVGGEPRVSLAVAARTVAWEEVAGSGSMPRARLSEVVDGKVKIRSVVARYLDGADAERVIVCGRTPRPDVAAGRQLARVSSDLPVMASAKGLAERMGAAAIVDDVRGGELVDAIDEAWLRGLPVIAVPGIELDAGRLSAVPLRGDHALVIAWPDDAPPVALEELPRIEA
jgi:hypothetical protein